MQKPLAYQVSDINPDEILYNLNGFTNFQGTNESDKIDFHFTRNPLPFEAYQPKFDKVVSNIKAGNSFLVNLSMPTPIDTDLTLRDIFRQSDALYRFYFKDQFVCFSPEIFIRISGNRISSFPMKGTIDASIDNAEEKIISDPKEAAEHATIVDLIRNDMSMVCDNVWVERYRYIDQLKTSQKTLLQVSSEIAGTLPPGYDRELGDILWKLLPAGSICGAPKPSTLNIIKEAEGYDRGYYTGVMGYFDGEHFESAVMIRFIEKQNEQYIFKSGGGITAKSDARSEYQEVIDKVYLPFEHAASSLF